MVRVVITKKQKELILLLSQDNVYIQFGGQYSKCINPLLDNGLIEAVEFHQNGNTYALSQTGQEWLDFVSPMVDQPQPADVQTIDGEVSFMAPDGKIYDGTIKAGADRYGYTICAIDGTVYDEIKRSDIEPRLADEIDDLPFTDVGKEDTQELPIVVDTPAMSLSQLVDAALDPDNQDAYAKLQAMDFSLVSLAEIEPIRDDVTAYKWDIYRDLAVMKFGFFSNNTEYFKQLKEVERAFNVDDILTKAMKPFQAVR